MKRNDWLLIATAIIFSVLFYKQATGLNYLLFTVLVTGVIAYFNPGNSSKKQWWYYAVITNLCGFAVFYCNSNLSVFACILSLFIFSGKSFNYKNSVILNLIFSIGSVISSVAFIIIDQINFRKQNNPPENKKQRKIYFGIFIALVIAIVFFALYQQANPLFKDFTKNIDLSWISIGWCLFTVWGFLIMYGLIYYRDIKLFSEWDIKFNRTLLNNSATEEKKEISNNTVIALALFGLLNIMLLLVNALDLTNLFGSHELPKGVYLSDFVHNAVWSLVFSIIIAVGLIMWFFKGELNFNTQSKSLKLLVYSWILQSAVMIVSAMIRNSWYVTEYQLTYLRIGVYVFLSLCLVGLFFTFLKISKTRSAWYLVRQNFEAWFLILALCSLVNWDKLISDYNISHAKNLYSLDKSYLVGLSNANLPELTEVFFNDQSDTIFRSSKTDDKDYAFKLYSSHVYDLLIKKQNQSWQSFNLRDKVIYEKMNEHFKDNRIKSLSLEYSYNIDLKNLLTFKDLQSLTLNNQPINFELIAYFKNLEALRIGSFDSNLLKNILLNKKLRRFELVHYYGATADFNYFKLLKNLEVISLPSITSENLLKLNNHPSLKILKIQTLDADQKKVIAENRLSYKVEEVGYAGR